MANIKYRLIGKTDPLSIYLRFNLGRKKDLQVKTGLSISNKDWSRKTHFPLEKSAHSKQLKNKLKNLESFVLNKYNLDYSKGYSIDKEWLRTQMLLFFNRKNEIKEETKDLKTFIKFYNERIKYENKSESTLQKYRLLERKISEFENYTKATFKIDDFNEEKFLMFRNYLITKNGLMESTTNRTMKNLKTVLRYARKKGYDVSNDLDSVKTPAISGKKFGYPSGK